MTAPKQVPAANAFLAGGGKMGELIRSKDWSETPLGPIESWPQSLRTAVSICIASNFPIDVVWGPDRIQLYNDGYWPICGGKHPESMGQDFRECWESAWPAIGEPFERALAGESTYIENRRIFLDRYSYLEETFFTFTFSPIRDETGGIGGLFHPVTETTAKMLNERRTRALRDVAERAGNAHTVENAYTRIADVLAEFDLDVPFALLYSIAGQGEHAHLAAGAGLPAGTVASPESIELIAAEEPFWPVHEVVATGNTVQVDELEDRIGSLSCGPYPESPRTALALPINLPGGERPAGILVAGVSSRLPLNEAYCGFYDLLTSAITAAVANARAYEAERERAEALAELDRAKTAFFSNVSHEFRTPLTLMLGPVADSLTDEAEPLSPGQRERQELVHRNALRLLKLVNTLLDFSRIEAGRIQASYRPTDLAAYTAELASMFRAAIEKAELRLNVDATPLPEPVYVDREMWEKIVMNLLSNAFKYTFDGEISVSLNTSGDHVELRVSDTGVGVPEDELPHLFERFHRVRNTRSRTDEGTGIGLALVRELARLHGGDVRVESREGEGSTFTVSVRMGRAHLPADRIEATSELASTAMGTTPYVEEALRWLPDVATGGGVDDAGNGRHSMPVAEYADTSGFRAARPPAEPDAKVKPAHVLIADDNADMRDYLGKLLEKRYAVTVVPDGNAALAAVREDPPDLVLTDVMMPGMDGFELLRTLREDPDTREIPVVLLSARAGEESRVEGLEAGADDYLIKPFSARELLARIGAHLELARVREEAETELRASEERLRFATESAHMFAWEVDVGNGTLTRSDNADTVGDDPTPTTLAEATAMIHQEDRVRIRNEVEHAIEECGEFEAEYRMSQSDNGDVAWHYSAGSAIAGADGATVRMVGVTQDITERKRTELLLFEQRRLLELIASGRPLEDCLISLCEAVPKLNAGVRAAVNLANDARTKLTRFFTPDLLPSFARGLENAPIDDQYVGTCGTAIFEGKPVVSPDITNDEKWSREWRELCVAHGIYACRSTPIPGGDGRSRGSFVLCFDKPREPNDWELRLADFGVDIATIAIQRDRAQQRMREDLEGSRLLRDVSAELIKEEDPDALYGTLVDAAVTLMRADFASLQLLEPESGELRLLAHRGFSTDAARFWSRVRADGGGTCAEALRTGRRVVAPDVETSEIVGPNDLKAFRQTGIRAVQTTPLVARDGSRIGMISTHWKDTHEPTDADLRSFDLLARQAADAIERERTVGQIKTAREEAEDANRAKSRFLATMSHELRTPLNAIMGYTDLLKAEVGGPLSMSQKEYLARVDTSSRHLLQLIEEVLTFSRIQAGREEVQTESINLPELVRSTAALAEPLARNKGLDFQMSLSEDIDTIETDPRKLRQILLNLLSNAVKFTQNGSIHLEVQSAEGDRILFRVTDTGIGIAPEDQEHIFEAFSQLEKLSSHRPGGTGLGLSVTRQLAQLLGGDIALESTPGEGSTFSLRLPVVAAAAEAEAVPAGGAGG